ncbi:MAG: InlB B-repeat-containing protein [Firmicutes bacterium]|nr:InlB B-repeat-containing protein [Bacillota bacterium]
MSKVIVRQLGGVLLAIAMALALVPAFTQAVHAAAEEPPIEDGIYQISTADQMVWLSEQVNAGTGAEYDVILTDDIDLSEVNWIPIGYKNNAVYKGKFNGNKKTVTLDTIDASVYEGMTYVRAGLFGSLGSGGVITDLTVDGSVHVNHSISTSYIGSIVGYMESGSTVANCINDAEPALTGTPSSVASTYTAGITGCNSISNAKVINCYNDMDFEDMTSRYVSGITGYGGYSTNNTYYCVNGGAVTAKEDPYTGAAAAIDAYNYSKPTDCYNADVENTYKDASYSPNITEENMEAVQAKIPDWNAAVSAYTSVDDFWDVSPEGYPIPRQLNGYETIRDLTNVEIADEGGNAPLEGDFVSKYAPARSYVLPAAVTVKIGDEVLEADAYTWDKATGTLTIPEDEITGERVEITIEATEHSATHALTVNAGENLTYTASEGNAVTEDGKNVYEGTDFAFDLAADEHYQIGEITVTVAGAAVTADIEKNDLETEASVTIASADITGDLVIDIKAKASEEFNVAAGTLEKTDYPADNPAKAYAGWPLEIKLSPQEGFYLLKKNISITAGEEAVDADQFSYKDGVVVIDAAAVKGSIVINAESIPPILQEVKLTDELEDGEQYVITGTTLTDQNGDSGYALTKDANTTSNMKTRPVVLVEKEGKLYMAAPEFDQELKDSVWTAEEKENGFLMSNEEVQLSGNFSTLKPAEKGSSWMTAPTTTAGAASVKMNVATQSYSLTIEETNGRLAYGSNNVRLYQLVDSSLADHTVTFDSMGGSEVAPVVVKEGKRVKKPADPVKAGYSLEGWYKDKDRTEAWNFKEDKVEEDIALYAKWQPVREVIVRNVTAPEPEKTYVITNAAGTVAMSSAEATAAGSSYHYMAGENVSMSDGQDVIAFASDDVYKACAWKAEEGSATGAFKLYNDAISGNLWGYSAYLANSQASTTYKNEFVIGSYGMSVSGSTSYGAQYNANSGYFNLQFYASAANRVKFYEVLDSCQISFDLNDGVSDPILQTVKKGDKATRPEDPVREKCFFQGWKNTDGEDFDFETAINEDTALTAEWYSLEALSAELDEYVSEENLSQYRAEQQEQVKQAVAEGKTAIEAATSIEDAEAAFDAAVTAIEEIPTDAELAEIEAIQLEGAKAAAADVIDQLTAKAKEAVGGDEEAAAQIDAAAAEAKAAVDAAESLDQLTQAAAGAAAGINNVVTSYTEGQAQSAAADLAAAKNAATQAVLAAIDENGLDPAVTMQTAIDAILAINNADSIEAVNAAKAAADESIGALIAEKTAYEEAVKKAEAAAVTGFKAKAKKGKKAQLTWKAAKEVSGYEVYRATKKKGKYKKVKTISKATTKKLINKKLKAKKNYFYKIRPYTLVKNVKGETEKVYGKYSVVRKIKAKK